MSPPSPTPTTPTSPKRERARSRNIPAHATSAIGPRSTAAVEKPLTHRNVSEPTSDRGNRRANRAAMTTSGAIKSKPPRSSSHQTEEQKMSIREAMPTNSMRGTSTRTTRNAALDWASTSVDLDDSSRRDSSGFSPNALLDRYTAEMEQTARHKEQAAPHHTSLQASSSLFWGSPSGSSRGTAQTASTSGAASSTTATGTTSAAGSDLDLTSTYGRPAHMRRNDQQEGVFGKKKRFEHVDQSVNLMAMTDDSSTIAERRRQRFTTSGRFGSTQGSGTLAEGGDARPRRFRRAKGGGGGKNILRTLSRDMTEIFLGNSFRIRKEQEDEGDKTIREEGSKDDDDEEEMEISMMACCQCLCLTTVLLVVVLVLAGVIPMPGGSISAEKGGEDLNSSDAMAETLILPSATPSLSPVISQHEAMPSLPPKRLHSPPLQIKSGEDQDSSEATAMPSTAPSDASLKPSTTPSDAPLMPTTTPSDSPLMPSTTPSFLPTTTAHYELEQRHHNSPRWRAIESIILHAHISSARDLDDETSLAHKALEWMCETDPARLDPLDFSDTAHIDLLERYALVVFFYSTHHSSSLNNNTSTAMLHREDTVDSKSLQAALRINPHLLDRDESMQAAFLVTSNNDEQSSGWQHSSGWMTEANVCQWYGVQCHRSGRVSSIHLQRNHLTGQLPSELRALRELEHLDLSYNHLHQEIPGVLWDTRISWSHLITLDLSKNRLSGTLPDSLGSFAHLQNFTLDGNLFTGEIPTSIGRLTSLQLFSAQDNMLTGSIRDTSPIPTLRFLKLALNQLSGEIPFHLTRNRNLVELSLGSNRLEGTLPPEMDSLHKLQRLELGVNKFQGPVPDIFGRLHSLQVLDIRNNTFGQYHDEPEKPAKIPTSLGALTNLKILKINTNLFRGAIPEEWWNMKSLEIFHLYDNDLMGSIPEEINGFSRLRDFQVQDSFMTGTVPKQLGECQNLEKLMLYNSKFTGTIPGEICDLRGSRSKSKLSIFAADCHAAMHCACCDRCYR
ncbi:LRR receptor-like serine threonine-protein kinase At4g08850-like [Seminavis robusta]|uniref:LRR receptor-like serine threonine-protein kinase At4g08850-like n=1 Tax=Seminavis robusta TaxID=568900 RepID=A0A9N8HM26_9STRA|nr:LRR receptor-like serine threonine-protein kinase At4g08850-like [Seminavis robusta]|eukprot:Sro862_g212490.1 LRR receptor-like serine threonine-protein kinase At4g08850-like (1011) ;mRNA; r:31660-35074